jgi:hypothetical protein
METPVAIVTLSKIIDKSSGWDTFSSKLNLMRPQKNFEPTYELHHFSPEKIVRVQIKRVISCKLIHVGIPVCNTFQKKINA